MKKTSIFLILATAIAMMFTSCDSILGEDTTATLEDFKGKWYYQKDGKEQVILNIEGSNATLQGIEDTDIHLVCLVNNGVLTVGNMSNIQLTATVNTSKTLITVTGAYLGEKLKNPTIRMNKLIEINDYVPDTAVTFDDYIGTWVGTTKNGKRVQFTFSKQNIPTTSAYVLSANITNLADQTLTGYVAVIKGTVTISIDNQPTMLFTMYMNKTRDAINITGTSMNALAGSMILKLDKAQ